MHYICTAECKGLSKKPGKCQAEDCSRHDQPLQPCDCKDGRHDDRQVKDPEGKS